MKKLFVCVIAILFVHILAAQSQPRLAIGWVNRGEGTPAEDAKTVQDIVERQLIAAKKFRVIGAADFAKLEIKSVVNDAALSVLQRERIDYVAVGKINTLLTGYEVSVYIYANGKNIASGEEFAGNTARELYDSITKIIQNCISSMLKSGKLDYSVGDRGPAGGWIFYDKGSKTDGWRYLEAAPKEAFFSANWGADGINISGTAQGIGTGKRNTEIIVAFMRSNGENGTAAQRCSELRFGGYNDWFLPSIDELDLIYKNLFQKDLGYSKDDFLNRPGNLLFYSSSQMTQYLIWVHIVFLDDKFYEKTSKSSSYYVLPIRQF